jgi:hypothetical protein
MGSNSSTEAEGTLTCRTGASGDCREPHRACWLRMVPIITMHSACQQGIHCRSTRQEMLHAARSMAPADKVQGLPVWFEGICHQASAMACQGQTRQG